MKEEGVRVEEEKEKELGWNDEICKSGRNISTSGYTNGRWPLFLKVVKARKLRWTDTFLGSKCECTNKQKSCDGQIVTQIRKYCDSETVGS